MLKKELELLLSKCKEFISNELTKFRGDGDAETNIDLWLFEEHRMANLRGHAVIDQGFFRVFLRWLKWKFKQYFTKSEIINKRYKHIEWITPQHVNAEAGGTAKYAFKVFDEDGFEVSETIIDEDGDKIKNERYNITFQSFIDENELGDSYADVTSEIAYENGHWVLSLTNTSEKTDVPFGGFIKISDNTKTDDEDTPNVNEMEEWLVDRVCGVVVEGMNIEMPELGFKDDGTSGLFVTDIKSDDTNPFLLTITRGTITKDGKGDDSSKNYVVSDVLQDGNNIKIVYSEVEDAVPAVSVTCYKHSETDDSEWEEFVPNYDRQYAIEYIEADSQDIKVYLKDIVIPDITLGLIDESTNINDGFINILRIDENDNHKIKFDRAGIEITNIDFKDTLESGEIQYVSKVEVPTGSSGNPLGRQIKVTYDTFTPTSGGTDFAITDGDVEDGKYVAGISATGVVTKGDLPTAQDINIVDEGSGDYISDIDVALNGSTQELTISRGKRIDEWKKNNSTLIIYGNETFELTAALMCITGNTPLAANNLFPSPSQLQDDANRIRLSWNSNKNGIAMLPYYPCIQIRDNRKYTEINGSTSTTIWFNGNEDGYNFFILPSLENIIDYYGCTQEDLETMNITIKIVVFEPADGVKATIIASYNDDDYEGENGTLIPLWNSDSNTHIRMTKNCAVELALVYGSGNTYNNWQSPTWRWVEIGRSSSGVSWNK